MLNHLSPFIYDNYNTVDLTSTNDFDACNLAFENDFATLNANIDLNGNTNVSLPVDIESLLINASLSDNSNQNVLIQEFELTSSNRQEEVSDEQSVTNNINPMFLFNRSNNQFETNSTDFNNNTKTDNKIDTSKFIKQTNKPSPILSQSPNTFNYHQQLQGKSSFHPNAYQVQQRKIVEEDIEDVFNQNHQINYYNNQHSQSITASSLPADSYLIQNFYNNNNDKQSHHYNTGRNTNQMISNQQVTDQQASDPTLTQVTLSNKANYSMGNLNKDQQASGYSNVTSSGSNRKISYLLSQQEQQQQQQQNMMQGQNFNQSHMTNNMSRQQQQVTFNLVLYYFRCFINKRTKYAYT